MALNLGNPTWLTLVADSATPADVAGYAGVRIPIPESVALPADGRQDTLTISGITVHGYVRDGAGGKEWVLTPEVDPNIAALQAVPGPGGWTSLPARDLYANVGTALLAAGVPGPSLRVGLRQLYQAAQADLMAKGWVLPG